MKIDRQIGILSILLQKDKITAAELAEKFEVSRRTIIRDIEDINRAGIPIQTLQGQNGGISIMENYRVDRTVLSSAEMQAILSGLQSLDSVSGNSRYRQLMEKLSADHSDMTKVDNDIIIDLGMWDKSTVSGKIELIKAAIEQKKQIAFTYFSPDGESERVIEPYHLVFQWASWYVWGYCTVRGDYRMFKLTRMTKLRENGSRCEEREVPEYVSDKLCRTEDEVVVRFDKAVKWRVIDEWGPETFTEDEQGKLIKKLHWSDAPSFYRWLLTFGEHAEILSPEDYREGFKELVRKIAANYEI